MNEQRLAADARQALDEAADDMPSELVARLDQARAAALARAESSRRRAAGRPGVYGSAAVLGMVVAAAGSAWLLLSRPDGEQPDAVATRPASSPAGASAADFVYIDPGFSVYVSNMRPVGLLSLREREHLRGRYETMTAAQQAVLRESAPAFDTAAARVDRRSGLSRHAAQPMPLILDEPAR